MKSKKLILSRNDVFIGKGYSTDGIVKLFVTNSFINNKNIAFVYMLNSISLWHYRLAHVGLITMK